MGELHCGSPFLLQQLAAQLAYLTERQHIIQHITLFDRLAVYICLDLCGYPVDLRDKLLPPVKHLIDTVYILIYHLVRYLTVTLRLLDLFVHKTENIVIHAYPPVRSVAFFAYLLICIAKLREKRYDIAVHKSQTKTGGRQYGFQRKVKADKKERG